MQNERSLFEYHMTCYWIIFLHFNKFWVDLSLLNNFKSRIEPFAY